MLEFSFTAVPVSCEGDTLVGRHVYVDQLGPGVVAAFHKQYGFGASSHTISFSTSSTDASAVGSANQETVKLRQKGTKDPDKRPWCVHMRMFCVQLD